MHVPNRGGRPSGTIGLLVQVRVGSHGPDLRRGVAMMIRLRSFARRRPLVVDAVAALALFLVLVVVPVEERPVPVPVEPVPTFVLLAASCGLLVACRRWPLPTLGLVVGVGLVALGLGRADERFAAPVLVAVYAVAVRTDRRTTVLAAVPTGLSVVAASVLFDPAPGFTAENLGRFAWIGMAAAVGDAVRGGRAHLAAVHERAERAERTREEEARRRVAEERLRIARELHDVVAHHIAVINVQAGVAGHLLATRPGEATAALGHIRRASRTVLDELSGLLGVLREPADPTAPTRPAPGLAELGALVKGFRASGLDVSWLERGAARRLPTTVDVVAYRLVQEALTNAHRHGTGTATLSVVRGPTRLTVEVTNGLAAHRDRTGDGTRGTGLGLVGMRERAAAVGGTVHTGPDADAPTFRVRAVLPLPPDTSDTPADGPPDPTRDDHAAAGAP